MDATSRHDIRYFKSRGDDHVVESLVLAKILCRLVSVVLV
jgi:hypothetical protein